MNDAPLGFLFTVLAVLIVFSGFFSSSETGMMSLNRYRLKHMQKNGHRGALRAGKLLDRPDRLIGLILIGNNLVNFLAASIATVVAVRLWGDAGVIVSAVGLTLVVLVFAEITPKTIAALHPERVAFPASLLLWPLMKVMYPVVALVNGITNGLLKLLGINPQVSSDENLSSEELRTIVTDAGQLIPSRHRRMLLNILELEEVTVNDIMVPRNEVSGIDLDDEDDEILGSISGSTHTRMPVYRENVNNLVGVLHMRSASRVITREGGLDREALDRELEKPYFVPENTPLHTQLMNFQKRKYPFAVVVDEYGDVMGLVVLEDILEEIVGEFTSNLTETEEIFPQRDGSFIIHGTATVRDVNKSLHWKLPTDGPKTLSGLVLEYLESFPDGNVGMTLGAYRLEILEIEGNVIKAVRARRDRALEDGD